MNEPEQPNVPLLAKSCVIGTDGICRITYWDGHQDALSDCRWVKMPVVDAEECIRQLYKFIYQQAKRVRELETVARTAKQVMDAVMDDKVDVETVNTALTHLEVALAELEEVETNGEL